MKRITDKQRLDWLEKYQRPNHIAIRHSASRYGRFSLAISPSDCNKNNTFRKLRDAIDAAMQKKASKK